MINAGSFLRIVFLFVLTSLLSGCFITLHHPQLEVVEGSFSSPAAKFKITEVDATGFYILAGNGRISVKMGVLPQYSTTHIRSEGVASNKLRVASAKYWLNKNSYNVEIRAAENSAKGKSRQGEKVSVNGLFMSLPKPLAALNTTIQGGGLRTSTINKIKAGENDVHRFVIPFTLNDDEYLIDVSFHVKLRTEWALR